MEEEEAAKKVRCGRCGRELERPLRCSRCRASWYCSVECQRQDWPAHKASCHPRTQQPQQQQEQHQVHQQRQPARAAAAAAASGRIQMAGEGDRPQVPVHLQQVDRSGGSKRDEAPDPRRFPDRLRVFTFIPSPDGLNENLLILLHGLGDTQQSYATLAKTMAVPQTCCMALRAPLDLPFDLGYGWYPAFNQQDGSLITPSPQEMRRINGLDKAQQLMIELLKVLEEQYEWESHRIFFMGFSQGAVVAVRVALAFDKPLGGVIAVSSSFLEEEVMTTPAVSKPRQTPIFVTHGTSDRMVHIEQARRHVAHLRGHYNDKELIRWKEYNKGHDMIKSEDEMRDVMQFLAEHLRLRSITLEQRDDLIEISSGK